MVAMPAPIRAGTARRLNEGWREWNWVTYSSEVAGEQPLPTVTRMSRPIISPTRGAHTWAHRGQWRHLVQDELDGHVLDHGHQTTDGDTNQYRGQEQLGPDPFRESGSGSAWASARDGPSGSGGDPSRSRQPGRG